MQNNGEKMPIFEGEDGKLYYNFAKGLKVSMHGSDRDKSEDYELEIVSCHYIGTTEYYKIKCDGVQFAQPISANRVKYLVSRYGVKMLAAGVRLEIPLLVSEVISYYEYRNRGYKIKLAAAELIPEFKRLRSEMIALAPQIGRAVAFNKMDELAILQAQKNELQRQLEKVLRDHDISPADIKPPMKCKACGGKGYDYNGVCACALAQSDKIKAFCAAERHRIQVNKKR